MFSTAQIRGKRGCCRNPSSSWMLDKAADLPAVRSEDLPVSNSSNCDMARIPPPVPPRPELRKQPPPLPEWLPPVPMRRPLQAKSHPPVPERPLGIAKYLPVPPSQMPPANVCALDAASSSNSNSKGHVPENPPCVSFVECTVPSSFRPIDLAPSAETAGQPSRQSPPAAATS